MIIKPFYLILMSTFLAIPLAGAGERDEDTEFQRALHLSQQDAEIETERDLQAILRLSAQEAAERERDEDERSAREIRELETATQASYGAIFDDYKRRHEATRSAGTGAALVHEQEDDIQRALTASLVTGDEEALHQAQNASLEDAARRIERQSYSRWVRDVERQGRKDVRKRQTGN